MTLWHKTLAGRFNNFQDYKQLLMICNELNQAHNNQNNLREFKNSIERALELFDFTIANPKWRYRLKEFLRAGDLVAQQYIADHSNDIKYIQKQIIMLNPQAWKMTTRSWED